MTAADDNLRVVLVRTRNPLNIGAAARAMSNFGFEYLRVVNPYDVAFREARSAVGAAKLLANAEEFKNIADAVADCTLIVGTSSFRDREPQHPVYRLDEGAVRIREALHRGKLALLFGPEKTGLSNRDLSYCHWLIRIPTREEHSSMNLAQAVVVCLYEIVRNRANAPPVHKLTPAAALQLDRITAQLIDVLSSSGYMKSRSSFEQEKIRRMVRRLQLDHGDAELWLGMLRQIAWKINNPG